MSYCDSVARTNKLYCSECRKDIKKGDHVVFRVFGRKMQDVYGECCKDNYSIEVYHDSIHPFSEEAFSE